MIIKPKDEKVSFRKVNAFSPAKYIFGIICGTQTLKNENPAKGTLIVKTKARKQTKALLKCTRFCEELFSQNLVLVVVGDNDNFMLN